MEAKTLRSVLPFVKEYAQGRGNHSDQKWPTPDHNYGNAISAIVGGNPLQIKRQPFNTTYCFATLNGGMNVSDPKAILIQIQPCPDDLDEEAYRHYIQWVLNYSPWRKVFVSKSIDRVLKQGVVVADATAQADTLMDGLIALRQAWDNYYKQPRYKQIGLWWELIQKVDPIPAFAIISNLIYLKDKDTVAEGLIHPGHSPFGDANVSLDNFVRRKLVDESGSWAVDDRGRAWKIWDHGPHTAKLATLVKASLVSIGKDKGRVNPFGSDMSKLYDRRKAIDCLISEIPNMEKEIVV